MYNHPNCPVCESVDFRKFLACKDYTVSLETFTIVECNTCGFKFTNPIPDSKSLGNYYKSEDYISHSNTTKGLVAKLYHLVRDYTIKKKLNLVLEHVSKGRILDYGCGTGMFLKASKESGWDPIGLEPDSGARKIATEVGLLIYENKSDLNRNHEGVRFHAITLWHVLEHITDLQGTLSFFRESIVKDGVLIIAVPNHVSYDAHFYGNYWAAYDLPRHLYHFESKTMVKLLDGFGFRLVATKPMRFDSYYVSMLSEKYKTGKIRYLNAIRAGFISNLRAKTPEQYSSVIYVFKLK